MVCRRESRGGGAVGRWDLCFERAGAFQGWLRDWGRAMG